MHTHCHLPEHWGDEWQSHWRQAFGDAEWPTVDVASYDQAMSEADVETAFVFGLRASRAGIATPNAFVADFCARTTTNTIGFMALDLSDDDVLDQARDGIDRGLRGVKLYPVLAHFDPADDYHAPFYELAQAHGLSLLWHMGGTASAAGRLAMSHPLVLDEVAYRYPDLVQIVAHMGSPWYRDTILLLRKAPRVFADVSGLWARPHDAYAALATAVEWGVTDKLLFGSDYPTFTPAAARAQLEQVVSMDQPGLPEVDAAIISRMLNDNPQRLLAQ